MLQGVHRKYKSTRETPTSRNANNKSITARQERCEKEKDKRLGHWPIIPLHPLSYVIFEFTGQLLNNEKHPTFGESEVDRLLGLERGQYSLF